MRRRQNKPSAVVEIRKMIPEEMTMSFDEFLVLRATKLDTVSFIALRIT